MIDSLVDSYSANRSEKFRSDSEHVRVMLRWRRLDEVIASQSSPWMVRVQSPSSKYHMQDFGTHEALVVSKNWRRRKA